MEEIYKGEKMPNDKNSLTFSIFYYYSCAIQLMIHTVCIFNCTYHWLVALCFCHFVCLLHNYMHTYLCIYAGLYLMCWAKWLTVRSFMYHSIYGKKMSPVEYPKCVSIVIQLHLILCYYATYVFLHAAYMLLWFM